VEQYSVGDCEDSCVDPDAEGKHRHSYSRESWIPPHSANRVAQIPEEPLEARQSPLIAHLFRRGKPAAEFHNGETARFLRFHALLQIVFERHFDMRGELRFEFAIHLTAADETQRSLPIFTHRPTLVDQLRTGPCALLWDYHISMPRLLLDAEPVHKALVGAPVHIKFGG